ncbi:S-adenosyl-L-methionine-dependent methyltransferase [Aspergillus unguis]
MGSYEEGFSPLIREIQDEACTLLDGSTQGPLVRARLLNAIDKLRLAVETPEETAMRIMYQPPQNAALRVLIDLRVFEWLVEAQDGISAESLAKRTNSEKGLIVRLMRIPIALGLVSNPVPDFYIANDKTAVFQQPTGRDGTRCLYDLTMPTFARLPQYFSEHNYAMPTEYNSSPMSYATGKSQFEWLADRPAHQGWFNSYMASRRAGKRKWFDIYPDREWVESFDNTPGKVFLVDVGGNQGHDLLKFREKYSWVKAEVILQDLPTVVDGVELEGVTIMPYDFSNEQPVKGAHFYFFRSIFHDWPDKTCLQILRNTVSAMSPDSRILIMDMVLPDTEVSTFQASLDIQMMCIGAGAERSRNQWSELLKQAGLEIRGVWGTELGFENVIEVGLVGVVG